MCTSIYIYIYIFFAVHTKLCMCACIDISAMSPCGAWWQPPERFGVAKGANEPFWCPIKKKPLFSMAQWLDPWILNAKGAKDPKGAMSPCGAWWQPPERFGVAKGANEPFWCSIKKKPEICVSDIEKTHKYIYVTPL